MRRAVFLVSFFMLSACTTDILKPGEDLWDWTFRNCPHDATPVRCVVPTDPVELEPHAIAFNPGLTEVDGTLWMAWRIDRHDSRRCEVERTIAMAPLDFDTLAPAQQHVYLDVPPAGRCTTDEDPRLFTHAGRPYLLYNACVDGTPPHVCARRRMFLAELAFDAAPRIAWARELAADGPGELDGIEKNWVPFSLPNGIGMAQHINPSVVLTLGDEALAQARASNELTGKLTMASPTRTSQRMPDDGYGPWRGGTPAVFEPAIDAYISIAHSFAPVPGTLRRIYFARAYAFAKDAPHAVTAYAQLPLHIPPTSDVRHERSRIVFPTGLLDRGDHYLVSLGHEDLASGIAILDKAALLQSLQPLAP